MPHLLLGEMVMIRREAQGVGLGLEVLFRPQVQV